MFHVLYQTFEILIDQIFKLKFSRLIREFSAADDDLHELRDKIATVSSERNRINTMIENCCKINSDNRGELKSDCEELLSRCGKEVKSDLGSVLYDTRCLIVHKLYTIDKQNFELINSINNAFTKVIYDIMTSFDSSSISDAHNRNVS